MRFNLISLLVLAGAGLLQQQVAAAEAGNYAAPDLAGFGKHNEDMGDGNGDGIDETLITRYINPAGDTIFSLTTRGRLWAWSLNGHDVSDAIDTNYVIRDSNCDGVFDERYGLDEDFHIPDCLQRQPGMLRPPGTPPVP